MAYVGKINARSPFYITATGTAFITSAELAVYIWEGTSAGKPAAPNYTITKQALTGTSTNIIFQISDLIRDSFNHDNDAYTASAATFTDALWVEIELDVVQTTDPQPSQINNLYLAVDGYGYHSEGVNPQGTDVIVNAMNVLTGQDILHPVYANSDGIDEVKYYSSAGALQTTVDLSTPVASAYSYDKMQYLTRTSASNTYSFELLASSVVQETVTINYESDCKYPTKAIKFIDRNGMLQKIYMFKKNAESINSKADNYNAIGGYISSNEYVYDATKHQNKTYNITSEESITCNSGYVLEAQNEVFKQILLSEQVWVDDKPVSVGTRSLQYKTRINDRLINYTMEFKYAYDTVNNIY